MAQVSRLNAKKSEANLHAKGYIPISGRTRHNSTASFCIYEVSFPSDKELKQYQKFLEEAEK